MTTADRLLEYLTEHGPADYYRIIKKLLPTRIATIDKAVQKLLDEGKIEEVELDGVMKLCIK